MTTINRDYLSPINRDNPSHLRRDPRVADQLRLDTRDQTIFPIAGQPVGGLITNLNGSINGKLNGRAWA